MEITGIIKQANYATFATKIGEYKDKVLIYVTEEQLYNMENIADIDLDILDSREMREILENTKDGDENKYVIQDNELRYRTEEVTAQEEEWLIKLKVPPMEQPIEIGNYLVNNTNYYDTLQEALEAATEGATIKIMKDTQENEYLEINKNINLNLNGKTINFGDNINIIIDDGISVIIEGNGTIIGKTSGSFIVNNGNLEVNDSVISSSNGGGTLYGTINNSSGNLIVNNSTIKGSTAIIGGATINNSNIEGGLSGLMYGGIVTINVGTVDEIDLRNGGSCVINSGIVGTILMGNNASNINVTIGNIDEAVNNNDPQIENITITTGDLAGIDCNINFYNGIIEQGFHNSGNEGYFGTYNVRPGYKTETTSDGTILVEK